MISTTFPDWICSALMGHLWLQCTSSTNLRRCSRPKRWTRRRWLMRRAMRKEVYRDIPFTQRWLAEMSSSDLIWPLSINGGGLAFLWPLLEALFSFARDILWRPFCTPRPSFWKDYVVYGVERHVHLLNMHCIIGRRTESLDQFFIIWKPLNGFITGQPHNHSFLL